MKNIAQTIDKAIYGYERNDFLPIYIEGQWANRNEFIAYKAKRVLKFFGDLAYKGLERLDNRIQDLYEK